MLDGVVTVNTQEAISTARRLAQEEGVFCGVSSGAAVAAAIKVDFQSETPLTRGVALTAHGAR